MPKKRIIEVIVKAEVPDNCSYMDVVNYVDDAVRTLSGSFEPPGGSSPDSVGDPLWGFRDRLISVKQYRRPRSPSANSIVVMRAANKLADEKRMAHLNRMLRTETGEERKEMQEELEQLRAKWR